jgi:hypothetical protein
MTLRFMPTTSVFDRTLATDLHQRLGITDHAVRTPWLMGGTDRSGQNDFRVRQQRQCCGPSGRSRFSRCSPVAALAGASSRRRN